MGLSHYNPILSFDNKELDIFDPITLTVMEMLTGNLHGTMNVCATCPNFIAGLSANCVQ